MAAETGRPHLCDLVLGIIGICRLDSIRPYRFRKPVQCVIRIRRHAGIAVGNLYDIVILIVSVEYLQAVQIRDSFPRSF